MQNRKARPGRNLCGGGGDSSSNSSSSALSQYEGVSVCRCVGSADAGGSDDTPIVTMAIQEGGDGGKRRRDRVTIARRTGRTVIFTLVITVQGGPEDNFPLA
jgi:hypothetical protein